MKADHDPFYNPVNDYVILPTAFDVQSIKIEEGLQVTCVKEEWEIIGEDQEDCKEDGKPVVSSIAVSHKGGDKALEDEALASIIVQPQKDGKTKIELKAVSISAGA